MRLSWFGDFFSTLPEALRALYQFGDPAGRGNGWWGIVILLIWGILLIGVPIAIAKRTYGKHEWVSATMGVVAGLAVFWWVYGILPSAWIYYLDSSQEILEHNIIPGSMGFSVGDYRVDIASDLYLVIRDSVVVIQHLIAFVITFWAALKIQQRLPKTLVPGETKPEAGGYK